MIESLPPFADVASAEGLSSYFPGHLSYPPRPVNSAFVHGSQVEIAGIEQSILDSSDLEDGEDRDYVDTGQYSIKTPVLEIDLAYENGKPRTLKKGDARPQVMVSEPKLTSMGIIASIVPTTKIYKRQSVLMNVKLL